MMEKKSYDKNSYSSHMRWIESSEKYLHMKILINGRVWNHLNINYDWSVYLFTSNLSTSPSSILNGHYSVYGFRFISFETSKFMVMAYDISYRFIEILFPIKTCCNPIWGNIGPICSSIDEQNDFVRFDII